jgi:hypothetical protein
VILEGRGVTKRLLIVSVLALMLVLLPGAATAKDVGKSDCKKGGWTEFVRTDATRFTDQGACIGYVSNGGKLVREFPFTVEVSLVPVGYLYVVRFADLTPDTFAGVRVELSSGTQIQAGQFVPNSGSGIASEFQTSCSTFVTTATATGIPLNGSEQTWTLPGTDESVC